MGCVVYGLYSTEDNILRYIGQTTQPLKRRVRAHIHQSKQGRTRRHAWIRKVLSDGFTIGVKILIENAVWSDDEMRLITDYRNRGYDLTNATDGGEGTLGMSEESRRRISEHMSSKRYSEADRKKFRDAHVGVPLSESHRNNMVESIRKAYSGEQGERIKAAMSVKRKGVQKSEAHKEAIRQAHLRRKAGL